LIRRALLGASVAIPLALLAALLALVFRAVASAPATPRPGGTYTEGLLGPVTVLNPLFAGQDQNAHDIDALLFEPLVRVRANGAIAGVLASKWQVSQDQRSYVFTIRPNARWSDGSQVTADDVVFTVRTVQDAHYPGALLNASWKDIIATVIDPGHVRFTLPGRNAGFMSTLELLPIVPEHLLSGRSIADLASISSGIEPVGSGPFEVSQQLSDRVVLERNPFSWRRPWIEHVVERSFPSERAALDALQRGEIDALGNLSAGAVDRLRGDKNIAAYQTQTYQYTELLFNLKPDVPFFQDRRVRQAIAMAIDRDAIIRRVLAGQARPADGPIPRAISWAYDARVARPHYDPQAAAHLLDQAGWTLQRDGSRALKDGTVLGFELLVSNDLPPYEEVAGRVATALAQVGIQVTVRPMPTASLIHDALNPRSYQMALTAVDNGPDPDVFPFWHSSQAHPGGFNFVSMKRNVFIDKDLEDGRATLDLKSRAKAYFDLQDLFAQEMPAVYLYSPTYTFAVSRGVHGVRLDSAIEPDGRYANVNEWFIEVGR
jgi:peptide/nickel transport system substrate-binding protein